MNGYHLVYNGRIHIRAFTYKTAKSRVYDDDESWKRGSEPEHGPRGMTPIPYRIWLRDPGSRAVILLDCPSTNVAFGAFGRLMDQVRCETKLLRPWRVFALVAMDRGWLLYEIQFTVDGDEYRYESSKLVKLRELTGIVGDESFKKDGSKP